VLKKYIHHVFQYYMLQGPAEAIAKNITLKTLNLTEMLKILATVITPLCGEKWSLFIILCSYSKSFVSSSLGFSLFAPGLWPLLARALFLVRVDGCLYVGLGFLEVLGCCHQLVFDGLCVGHIFLVDGVHLGPIRHHE
jgi:hypothetical protein